MLTMAYTAITSSYTLVGTISSPVLELSVVNGMNADIILSTDGVNAHMAALQLAPGLAFDVRTNAPRTSDYMLPSGISIYAKTAGSPSSGSLYIMGLIANVGA